MEFFNDRNNTSLMQQKAIDYIYSMPEKDVWLMLEFIERVKDKDLYLTGQEGREDYHISL